ncbi:MAG TPA: hypothetical protein VHE78_01945 [Gemmatimonadaceae bacterium]|nr:hypothetical protein [Gemmatimonadaceae bacterium]
MVSHLVSAQSRCHAFPNVLLVGATALSIIVGRPASARAQLVTPRTVPVHQGQQFDILPSARAGMASVSIALDDSLLDPFVNPAKAVRIREGVVFSAPFLHSVSNDRGGGRTLPIGGVAPVGGWAAAGVFALQQLDRAGPMRFNQAISDRTATNQYASLVLARRLSGGLAIGASASLADLNAVDGVDLLYSGSDHIDQSGQSADLRLGLTKEFTGNRRLEVMLLHNRFEMVHDVHYTSWSWQPATRSSVQTTRLDHNEDRTYAWGAHAAFTQPLGSEGWRIGWLATANQLSHPKIPNYALQNIPRDPGTTWGFNAGVGLARVVSGTTFGVDLIYEPMRSETWSDAARDTSVGGNSMIRAGDKTVENTFRFSNTIMRIGLSHETALASDSGNVLGFQLGLGLYSINYRLGQTNNLRRTFRSQREGWIEWTPTFGLGFHTHTMRVQYTFSLTCGPSSCMDFGGQRAIASAPAPVSAGGIIAAPSAPLTFDGGTVTSHKVWFSIPIR